MFIKPATELHIMETCHYVECLDTHPATELHIMETCHYIEYVDTQLIEI